MRHPQIVTYEADGFLAAQVADLARESRWLVRESRQPEACLNLLQQSGPAVLLIMLGPKLADELALLGELHEKAPDVPALVFSAAKLESADHRAALAGIACDLGARHVLFPPLARNAIEDLVAGMMAATIRRRQPAARESADA